MFEYVMMPWWAALGLFMVLIVLAFGLLIFTSQNEQMQREVRHLREQLTQERNANPDRTPIAPSTPKLRR